MRLAKLNMPMRGAAGELELEAKALYDYVYDEAKRAAQNTESGFGKPLTMEDREEAFKEYKISVSYGSWFRNSIQTRVDALEKRFNMDLGIFEKGGAFDLEDATKRGFYAGFGRKDEVLR